MMRRILVGLDGSEFSDAAVQLGIQWARQSGALLAGLGIIDKPTIERPEALPVGGSHYKQERDEIVLAEARDRVERFLKQFSERCTGASVAWSVLEDTGNPYEQILLEAQRYDLILLGQQTYFHFATQAETCETLRKVLKSSPRPVVTVPRKLGDGSAVVIAYDGSLQAARALQAFQALHLHGSQPVHVVSVNESYVEAIRRGERAIDFLGAHDIEAFNHPILLTKGSTAESLLEQVRELDACFLVMGAYGQPTLREFVLGSVTRSLLKDCQVPIFLYH